ncbi:MAG: proteasome subunit alpha [Propionibacteriaceae bacterium]|nr:proteasome subunit alpha [Propionibacteriaceae bacterium]
MTQPTFYVSPEQQIKDRAEFSRSGINKGRSVIVARYGDGILFITENRSPSLHKISEIYDRIGFAGVGKYNEFENLRVAGIRHADIRGYAYDRRDVTGRMLAGAYGQILGTIFSSVMEKPYEVELIIAEVGETPDTDHIFQVSFDGSITQETEFIVIGGAAQRISDNFREKYSTSLSLGECISLAQVALGSDARGVQPLAHGDLEVAILDRTRTQERKFRRLRGEEITSTSQPVKAVRTRTSAKKVADQ